MTEARIENVWTDCRFTDRDGVVWRVVDYWPVRWGSGLMPRYPGDPRALGRDFRRFSGVGEKRSPMLVEHRRYTFRPGELRGLDPVAFQRQLDAGQVMVRAVRDDMLSTPGAAPATDRGRKLWALLKPLSGHPVSS